MLETSFLITKIPFSTSAATSVDVQAVNLFTATAQGPIILDRNASVVMECDVTFYAGVSHLLRWYKDRLLIFEQFTNSIPFVHPLYKVMWSVFLLGPHLILTSVVWHIVFLLRYT